ncbi:MAG: bifunctional diguanylate cyclase/phosphodiesterase [Eubacteriales bacterium]
MQEEATGQDETTKYKVEEIHNILPWALGVLEEARDGNEAMEIIFGQVGRLFHVDAIVLFQSDAHREQKIICQWIHDASKEYYSALSEKYQDISVTEFLDWYDETGMMIIDSSITHHTSEEDGFHSMISIRSKYNKDEMAHLVFIDCMKERTWTQEEKILMKGLATIIYSHTSKFHLLLSHRETKQLLYYDSISQLPNLDKYYIDIHKVVNENRIMSYAIVVATITNFQYINETYGREIGNKILQSFGPKCRKILPICHYVARVSGGTFALLVENQELEALRREVIAMCREFTILMNTQFRIGNLLFVSGVCAISDRSQEAIHHTYKLADLARQSIKNNGYTECCLYNERLREKDLLKNQVITNMKFALENNEFHIYLQPKIDLQSEHIIGAEALVRWIYPDGTILAPDHFVPIFEENGLIKRLDFYVLRKTLSYIRSQLDQQLDVIPISVNFSRKHHEEQDFVETIIQLLDEYEVDKNFIEIEITESTFTDDKNLLSKNLELLQEQGLAVSIDDFGSGYSALNILSTIKANVIKIDKVFLQDDSGKNVNILKYLIQMIKSLNYQVIVEGVETQEQAKFLAEIECDMAQGYYYAKPMPMEEFNEYVRNFKGNL